MTYWVVIPARFGSTRLPGKPLMEISGWPMIQHVWTRAIASTAIKQAEQSEKVFLPLM